AVRTQPCRRGELVGSLVQAQEQPRVGKDVVIIALQPGGFFRRAVPIFQERGEVFSLDVKKRAFRHQLVEWVRGRDRGLEESPGRDGEDDEHRKNEGRSTMTLHADAPFAPADRGLTGLGAAGSGTRGRTARSCSSSV